MINTCVIDIGSPKQGNIGWAFSNGKVCHGGSELDDVVPYIANALKTGSVILGLEAPLFVPIREKLIEATKGRKGERNRPWSAGAGAQVLTMNLPIMTYLFKKVYHANPQTKFTLTPDDFKDQPNSLMVFEALVSGVDKGETHMDDAQIMVDYCSTFAKRDILPSTILEDEPGVDYMNLVGASLVYAGISDDISLLRKTSAIYKPSDILL